MYALFSSPATLAPEVEDGLNGESSETSSSELPPLLSSDDELLGTSTQVDYQSGVNVVPARKGTDNSTAILPRIPAVPSFDRHQTILSRPAYARKSAPPSKHSIISFYAYGCKPNHFPLVFRSRSDTSVFGCGCGSRGSVFGCESNGGIT